MFVPSKCSSFHKFIATQNSRQLEKHVRNGIEMIEIVSFFRSREREKSKERDRSKDHHRHEKEKEKEKKK